MCARATCMSGCADIAENMAEAENYTINVAEQSNEYDDSNVTGDDTEILIARKLTKNGSRNSRFPRLNKPSSLSNKKKLIIGLFIVCVIAFSWVGSTQTAKSSFVGNFRAPFFVMWFGTAWMMIVFPITAVVYFVTGQAPLNKLGVKSLFKESVQIFYPNSTCSCFTHPCPSLTVGILSSTVLLTIIWAATNYMYSRALVIIDPTDVTALFSSAPAFVFLFSICILREPPLVLRLASVLLAITGIVLFAYEENFKSANIVGVVLSVGAAIGAACYKVYLKWRVGDANLYQMGLFLSTLGLFCTISLWPMVLLLHFLNIEPLVDIPWTYLCASSALGVVFNFSINFGIAYTFPLFISLGTVLGIPLNALFDSFIRKVDLLNWKFTAADLIVGGFLLMLVPPSDSEYLQKLVIRTFTCKPCHRKHTVTVNQLGEIEKKDGEPEASKLQICCDQ